MRASPISYNAEKAVVSWGSIGVSQMLRLSRLREVARLFEQAGVPRTKRSIINWGRHNRQGVARLDAFFDDNEGRYYITPQNVTRAIEEERAKQTSPGAAPAEEPEMPKRSEFLQITPSRNASRAH